jgi:hypothetical protein
VAFFAAAMPKPPFAGGREPASPAVGDARSPTLARGSKRMACLLALLTGLFPRLGLLILWIFTNEVDQAFDGFILPLLGLIFLPLMTFVYALLWAPFGGVDGIEWFWVVLAFLFDIGALGAGARSRTSD